MSDSIGENTARPMRSSQLQAILASGADARSFLQGQLSADMNTLTPDGVLLASCNSSQGRVQAVLWLIERSDGIALILPASMTDTTIARLRKYTLRSKVKIESAADRLPVAVISRRSLSDPASVDAGRHREQNGISHINLTGQDLILSIEPETLTDADTTSNSAWRIENIRAGLPQVYPQTHETFVAQMLNLDLLGGISFGKGCYTGQEIIARTHYRGAIKRRMFRFKAACQPPQPGTRIVAGGQHAGDVVDAAAGDEGCELLAVVSVALADEALELESARGVRLERVEMPYRVMCDV